jgi:hypothetical protein
VGHGLVNAYAAVNSVLPTPTISGASSLYSLQQATYTVQDLPTGTTVTWSGSSNVNIVSGQGTSQATISICGGSTATLTATLSGGAINNVLTKTLNVNNGNLTVNPYINKINVTFSHPYAQCYDWDITSDFTSEMGNGIINCSNYTSLSLVPVSFGGNIKVRAKDSSCVNANWITKHVETWQPQFSPNSNFSPASGSPFEVYLVERCPEETISSTFPLYYWYFNNTVDVSMDPYFYTNSWPCGYRDFIVEVKYLGYEAGISDGFYGMCNNYYSAAYPNPASNELIIDKIEEESNTETAAIIAQSARGKTSEIRVLLYSNSTAQLVYNKVHLSSDKQIKIDTSKLPNGIYHLNIIENGEKIKEQTIIVNH